MPPKTSPTEVFLLLGISVLVGLFLWYSRFVKSTDETNRMIMLLNLGDVTKVPQAQLAEMIQRFHRGFVNLVVTLVPILGFWFTQTCVSLARDAGFVIFPWIILASVLVLLVNIALCERLRKSLIRKLICNEKRYELENRNS